MKRLLLFFLSVAALGANAQNIEVANNAISFQNATEFTESTEELVIYNPGIYPIEITGFDLFEMYSHEPFTVKDTSFVISPLDTQKLMLRFLPRHNIDHEMGLVIKTSAGFGHVAVSLTGQGEYTNSYYDGTQNLTGSALRSALSTRIGQNYNSLGYTAARDNMYASIDNDGGDVECVYTGRTATFTTRSGANNNNFNCEHTFPQGHFNKSEPMRSDIHHLFPTDVQANSRRGNDPFGVVNNPSWSQGGSKSGGGKFEPRDAQKGRTARAMMYFVLRYQDYQNFFQGQENILYQWHEQFPPDQEEEDRNADIYNVQNNRNPFVDYPQFMDRMNSLVGNADLPGQKELYLSDDTIHLARRADRHVYDFVLYNEGNEDITLTNFSLSDTSLHFEDGTPGNLIIGPHQIETLRISFQSATDYQGENLHFETDVAGMATVAVPIFSGASMGTEEREMLPRFEVYPNPAESFVTVSGKIKDVEKVWATSVSGVKHSLKLSKAGRININALTGGVYVLTLVGEDGASYSERIVVNP